MRLRVFTLNCWILPFFLSADNHLRLEHIVETIKFYDPDIVTLQEVWRRHHVRYFARQLPSYSLCASGEGWFNRGGLLTLTKQEPRSHEFQPFPISRSYNTMERIGGKGILKITLNVSGSEFNVVNTHLYCADQDNHHDIEESQFMTLKKFVHEDPTIVTGDLNGDYQSFLRYNEGHFMHDGNDQITDDKNNRYHTNHNKTARSRKKDYVLVYAKPDNRVSNKVKIKTEVLTTPVLSDHYAVLADIEF